MFDNLFSYFHEELSFKKEKDKLDEYNYYRNRYMAFFVVLFIILLLCSFFNII